MDTPEGQPTPPTNPAPVRMFSADDISAIPPELRKQLNIIEAPVKGSVEEQEHLSPEVLMKIREIAGHNSEGQEIGGFSWAALVYGPFYYGAMKDWPFAVVSALASISLYGTPLLIPLAFFARKRAWQRKEWESVDKFMKTQKQWDRSAIVGFIISIIAIYFVTKFIFSELSSTFGTTDPTTILNNVQSIGS